MAKLRSIYVCQGCGHQVGKWHGRCPACNQFGSIIEERVAKKSASTKKRGSFSGQDGEPTPIDTVDISPTPRMVTNLPEFDRVLGGGLVPGSLVLLGGDPGIGKSTLILLACFRLMESSTCLYVTAEESLSQLKLRADRLKVHGDKLLVVSETNLEQIEKHVDRVKPKVLVIDSIQTVYSPDFESAPGSVAQVREAAARLMYLAKGKNIATFVIGHVTKEGAIAGPRVLEHMVDTVLYFEGEKTNSYRILRAHKNRFGSTNEIGVFEMRGEGLVEVQNPSAHLLAERPEDASGSTVVPSLEGTRPLLVEIQGLVTPSPFGTPRRTALGVDPQRIALLTAIAERHVGIDFIGQDVYVNVAGGVRLDDPAADLAVVMALVSSARRKALTPSMIVMGECGLSGEIRSVVQAQLRLGEAFKLGFDQAIIPHRVAKSLAPIKGMQLFPVRRLDQACEVAFGT